MADTQKKDELGSPPALLAVLQAARRVGDRQLELVARRQLEALGIIVTFKRKRQVPA